MWCSAGFGVAIVLLLLLGYLFGGALVRLIGLVVFGLIAEFVWCYLVFLLLLVHCRTWGSSLLVYFWFMLLVYLGIMLFRLCFEDFVLCFGHGLFSCCVIGWVARLFVLFKLLVWV